MVTDRNACYGLMACHPLCTYVKKQNPLNLTYIFPFLSL